MTKQEKAEGEHMRKVYRLIRQLGMTSKYKGYYYVAEAVMMSMELQDYPIKITKDIYPYLAKNSNQHQLILNMIFGRSLMYVGQLIKKRWIESQVILFATDLQTVSLQICWHIISSRQNWMQKMQLRMPKRILQPVKIQSMFLKKFRNCRIPCDFRVSVQKKCIGRNSGRTE